MAVNVMGAETAFTADFSTADEASVADWTIIDANADKSTWKFDSSAEPSHIFYSYNSNNAADDWLISPQSAYLPTVPMYCESNTKAARMAKRLRFSPQRSQG